MGEPESWKASGVCHPLQQTDPQMWERFFAETALERRDARNLCNLQCPVRLECLRAALEHKEIWGVWGGCDEAEIRRALWVDADGEYSPRCRYPQCPACHARPNKLMVVSRCDLGNRRKRENVECAACGFYWRAATSVTAVKAYWRERARATKIRAHAPRGRIPSERRMSGNVVTLQLSPMPVSDREPAALAASAHPA